MAQYNGWGTKVDCTNYDAFRTDVLGNGFDVDGAYGDQCYDGAAIQLVNTTGRKLNTGGTGAARGAWEVPSARAYNAGGEYELITDRAQIRRGDMLFWHMNNQWGHVAFADEDFCGDYITCLGQNQRGNGSGYPFTLDRISLATFLGALRYKAWLPAPAPVEEPEEEKKGGNKIAKVLVPTGITLAALAAALGLSIPQLLQGDKDGSLQGVDPEQTLTDDQAKDAANAAETAVKEVKQKTPVELARERVGSVGTTYIVQKYDRATGEGTIWQACKTKYGTNAEANACTARTVEANKETITIEASKHNVKDYSGHWVWQGEEIVIW